MGQSDAITSQLWSRTEHIHRAALAHPFLTGLTDGTLAEPAFRHFIVQDAHYLRGYARALAVCAAKAPTEADTVMFAQHAAGAITAEQDMHAELMAALVGEHLLARSSPHPLYARWIATYGGEDFQSVVDEVLALTERIGPGVAPDELERMTEHFVTTSRYEWMFWDAGYRQETWPV